MRSRCAELLLLLACLAPARARAAFEMPRDDFRLIDSTGRSRLLSTLGQKKRVALVAWDPACGSASAIQRAAKAEFPEGELWLLDPAPAQNRDLANQKSSGSVVLMDHSQMVARGLGFERSGDFLELDTATWKELRRGSLVKPSWLGRWLPWLRSEACPIFFPPGGEEFTPAVAAAFQRQCLTCHQAGRGDGLFPSFEKLRGWSAMNRQVLRRYSMPPGGLDYESPPTWPSFDAADLRLIQSWVERGSKPGPGADSLFSVAAKSKAPATQKRRPDLVWEMKRADLIPAEGGVKYAHRQFGPTKADIYMHAAELEMNLRTTHHLAVYVSHEPYPEADLPLRFAKEDPGAMGGIEEMKAEGKYLRHVRSWEKIIEWGLNKVPRVAYPGTVFFIPKGSYVLLEHHYQPNGRPEKNRTKLSVYFDPEPKGKGILHKVLLPRARTFAIPPHESNFSLVTSMKLERDVTVYSFMSHGHYRHSGYRVKVEYPGGEKRLLANLPFRQLDTSFEFKLNRPVFLPAGATVEFELFYDNSAANPVNPDPTAWVRNGSSLLRSEMNIGQLTLVEGRMPEAADLRGGALH